MKDTKQEKALISSIFEKAKVAESVIDLWHHSIRFWERIKLK